MNIQYYILVESPHLKRVLEWIGDNDIPHELHLNRVRFRPHSEALLLQYHLQYSDYCSTVELPYPTII